MRRQKFELFIEGSVRVLQPERWRQFVAKLSNFLVERFDVLERGRLVKLLKMESDLADDFGEPFSQDVVGGCCWFVQWSRHDRFARFDVGEFNVSRLSSVAVCVGDRRWAAKDKGVAVAKAGQRKGRRGCERSHSLDVGVIQVRPQSSSIFRLQWAVIPGVRPKFLKGLTSHSLKSQFRTIPMQSNCLSCSKTCA